MIRTFASTSPAFAGLRSQGGSAGRLCWPVALQEHVRLADSWCMAVALELESSPTAGGNHFSCSMTTVLLSRVQASGGQDAVAELLHLAGSKRSPDYLLDIVNWVSYDEAVALWRAGARVTRHPQFARRGCDARARSR